MIIPKGKNKVSYLVCFERLVMATMFGVPGEGTVKVAYALNWFKVSVT